MAQRQYCTVQQVRDRGFRSPGWPSSRYSDEYIEHLIEVATNAIEAETAEFFLATTFEAAFMGNNRRMLGPIRPVLSTLVGTEITVAGTTYTTAQVQNDVELVDLAGKKCRQHLRLSDSPSYLPARWPVPQRRNDPNVFVDGPFGWLDPDSEHTGNTPSGIVHACSELVARFLVRDFNETTAADAAAGGTGALKKDKTDTWERQWYEPTDGSSGAGTAKSLTKGDDIQLLLQAFTCPKRKVAFIDLGRW